MINRDIVVSGFNWSSPAVGGCRRIRTRCGFKRWRFRWLAGRKAKKQNGAFIYLYAITGDNGGVENTDIRKRNASETQTKNGFLFGLRATIDRTTTDRRTIDRRGVLRRLSFYPSRPNRFPRRVSIASDFFLINTKNVTKPSCRVSRQPFPSHDHVPTHDLVLAIRCKRNVDEKLLRVLCSWNNQINWRIIIDLESIRQFFEKGLGWKTAYKVFSINIKCTSRPSTKR